MVNTERRRGESKLVTLDIPSLTQDIFYFSGLVSYHDVNMLWYSGQRIVGIKITETVMETESETGTERESEDRKKKNESEGRMKNGGKGNVMMENAPTKRETRRGRRTRSVFGRKERMKTLESPLLMLTLKSHQGTTKKKTVPEKTAWETRYTTCHTFKIITIYDFFFLCFWKQYLVITRTAFIWSNIQWKE